MSAYFAILQRRGARGGTQEVGASPPSTPEEKGETRLRRPRESGRGPVPNRPVPDDLHRSIHPLVPLGSAEHG